MHLNSLFNKCRRKVILVVGGGGGGERRQLEMGEDACSTFQGSKSVIWNLFVSVL